MKDKEIQLSAVGATLDLISDFRFSIFDFRFQISDFFEPYKD